MRGPKLTDEQIRHFKAQMIKDGTPVRFLYRGHCLDITTGVLQHKGINVIYQRHYWNFAAETAKEIAKSLGSDVRAILSK